MRFGQWCFLLTAVCLLPSGVYGGDFDALIERFLAAHWKANPTAATRAGVHNYDSQLEDFTATALQAELRRYESFINELERLRPESLTADERIDRELALDHVRLVVLEHEEMQVWKRDPRRYVELLRDSLTSLAYREFAAAERRFRSAANRLKLFPKALQHARLNLESAPELFTREAIAAASATAEFAELDLAAMAAEQGAAKRLTSQVSREGARAAAALRDFAKWLQSDLAQRKSHSVIGAELYARRFRMHVGARSTPEEALAAAERDLRSSLAELAKLPNPSPADVPASEAARSARTFVAEKRLAPLPQPDRLRVDAMPQVFGERRAFLDAPGPFESDLSYRWYVRGNETLDAAAREAYPGRYVQLHAMSRTQRLARKVFARRAFRKGWPLYAEQVMAEAGFFPTSAARAAYHRSVVRAQLAAIADLRLHTGKSTAAELVRFVAGQGGFPTAEAEEFVRQALLHPGHAAAAYAGKLQIIALREQVRRKRGHAFSLGEFHEAVLQ